MQYVFGILLLLSTSAFAGDWFCEETASERMGNTIKTCGIGVGMIESAARYHSLKQARYEFQALCQLDTECRTAKKVVVNPGRTDCKKHIDDGLFYCTRILSFEIEG